VLRVPHKKYYLGEYPLPKAYPAEAIAKLYLQRWSVELHFKEIKILLSLDILSCLSPAMF
jgi:IS4 transposase